MQERRAEAGFRRKKTWPVPTTRRRGSRPHPVSIASGPAYWFALRRRPQPSLQPTHVESLPMINCPGWLPLGLALILRLVLRPAASQLVSLLPFLPNAYPPARIFASPSYIGWLKYKNLMSAGSTAPCYLKIQTFVPFHKFFPVLPFCNVSLLILMHPSGSVFMQQ